MNTTIYISQENNPKIEVYADDEASICKVELAEYLNLDVKYNKADFMEEGTMNYDADAYIEEEHVDNYIFNENDIINYLKIKHNERL